ncbi:MAG: HNH endonuclease [Bacteriovoracia bacterium]
MSRKQGFTTEVGISFDGERFLVRDNGLVCRLKRPNQRERVLDDVWTYGNQCTSSGYMKIGELVVHRIVATAFHGEQPSSGHVVDHIDTNRANNRIENLRWVTRLENITGNEKTLKRIEQKWGSIEGMLQDPDRVRNTEPLTNRPWMRQIEEERYYSEKYEIASLTPLAVQRNWRTPCEFPLCPSDASQESLVDYFFRLKPDSVFSRNRYGEGKVEMAELSSDSSSIVVITRPPGGIKGWAVARITFENDKFVHESCRTFFTLEGAEKQQFKLLGKPWDKGDTFDDFC